MLRTFKPGRPDAFYGFLKVVTANVVHDHFKGSHGARRGSGRAFENTGDADIGAAGASKSLAADATLMERQLLIREIDREFSPSVPAENLPQSRLIFWPYYRCGLTASAIASFPNIGLTTKGVESALFWLTRIVRAAVAEQGHEWAQTEQDSSLREKGLRQKESFKPGASEDS